MDNEVTSAHSAYNTTVLILKKSLIPCIKIRSQPVIMTIRMQIQHLSIIIIISILVIMQTLRFRYFNNNVVVKCN